jgi:hypothetical protein
LRMGFRGGITESTPAKFLEFSRGNLTANVYLHSPGGSLIGGVRLGELFRKLGMGTAIGRTVKQSSGDFSEIKPGKCLSACAFAFMVRSVRVPPGLMQTVDQMRVVFRPKPRRAFADIHIECRRRAGDRLLQRFLRLSGVARGWRGARGQVGGPRRAGGCKTYAALSQCAAVPRRWQACRDASNRQRAEGSRADRLHAGAARRR